MRSLNTDAGRMKYVYSWGKVRDEIKTRNRRGMRKKKDKVER